MNKVINTTATIEEIKNEGSLRPKKLDDYLGQTKAKESMKISIEASKKLNESLDHVLLYGPPGLGKTTLANIIANEMGVNIKETSGPVLDKPGELVSMLKQLSPGDVFFIDEIHRLPRQVEETLYLAMEDFCVDVVIGEGASSKSIRVKLPKFTLVGATTRAGMLTAPLRDRFGIIHRLEYYTVDELKVIIINSARKLGVEVDTQGAIEMAKRSRGTPRIANRILKRVRDYAVVKHEGVITLSVANEALDMMDIDKLGLDNTDRNILFSIIEKFNGGPVGLDTLSAATGEDSGTIEDVIEPYLIQNALIERTPRGRIATDKCYGHLGLEKKI